MSFTRHQHGGLWSPLSGAERIRKGCSERIHCVVKGLEVLQVVGLCRRAQGSWRGLHRGTLLQAGKAGEGQM